MKDNIVILLEILINSRIYSLIKISWWLWILYTSKKDNFWYNIFNSINDHINMKTVMLTIRNETSEWMKHTIFIMREWHELNVHEVSRTFYTRTRILTYCPESRTMKNQSRSSSCRTFELSRTLYISCEYKMNYARDFLLLNIHFLLLYWNYRYPCRKRT